MTRSIFIIFNSTLKINTGKHIAFLILYLLIFCTDSLSQCSLNIVAKSTNPSCGLCNGRIDLTVTGGSYPYLYSWTSGGNKATEKNLCAGFYTCTVTDKIGCSKSMDFIIESNSLITPTLTVNNISCPDKNDGNISIIKSTGGVWPYSYNWSPISSTSKTINNLSEGTYYLETTDSKGCVSVNSYIINKPQDFNSKITKTNISCDGLVKGTASIEISGGTSPYTYLWNPGNVITSSIDELSAGNYTCVVTDSKGCIYNTSTSIIQPKEFTTTIVSTNVTCKGGSDGSATVKISGGTPPYTFAWSPYGGTSITASKLKEGNFYVEISDSNKCESSNIFKISSLSAISVDATINDSECNNDNGSIQLNPKGGAQPYTYQWVGYKNSTPSITSLSAGTYKFTIKDKFNCSFTSSATVGKMICTDIDYQTEEDAGLSIYPNPARDFIKIESTTNIDRVILKDVAGKIIFDKEYSNELALSSLEKGIYIIQISNPKGIVSKKIVIE